jgi:hypothetical protein
MNAGKAPAFICDEISAMRLCGCAAVLMGDPPKDPCHHKNKKPGERTIKGLAFATNEESTPDSPLHAGQYQQADSIGPLSFARLKSGFVAAPLF